MAYKITFKGLVQGVGFRPFLYRRANKLGINGFVRNTGNGVDLVMNKRIPVHRIIQGMPPMARVDSTKIQKTKARIKKSFEIRESKSNTGHSEIPADIFLCKDCLKELRSPNNRRFRYPFISCTNCGPRFSVVTDTPYDRERTSLNNFPLCPECRREYEDPNSRFYHAETTACSECGPQLALYQRKNRIKCSDPIKKTAQLINNGKIVAIKGIGGFHLVCLPTKKVVSRLRQLTERPRKPYALMAPTLDAAKKITKISKQEATHLESPARPIVILQKKLRNSLPYVSKLDSLGIMLPYTGLHYLLFDHFSRPLVFTSANLPGNPLTTKRSEQFVDLVLDHNRKIVNPIDDSVIKIINGHPLFLRRARGYVPSPVTTGSTSKEKVLALGAEQNSTFCLNLPNGTVVSQHLGNTQNLKTFEHFRKTITDYKKFYQFKPEIILLDKNPRYNTTNYGKNFRTDDQAVQHHIAHIMSVAAEHNLQDFIGIAADGTGYGNDSTIWGGEIFRTQRKYRSQQCLGLLPRPKSAKKIKGKIEIIRVGSLELQPMIGGDKATLEPPRMLLAILNKSLNKKELWKKMSKFYTKKKFVLLRNQLEQRFNITQTSSTGRILDAAATMLEICSQRTYEGEPAITLEANSSRPYKNIKPVLKNDGKIWRLQTTPLFRYLTENIKKDKNRLAATVQKYLAEGFWELTQKENAKLPIVFSGGVAYNRIISTYLSQKGVLLNKKIPPGDGGISFGQIYSHKLSK